MKAESLIFDIDGTLWDTRSLVAEGYNRQLQKEGLHHLCTDADRLTALFGKNAKDLADELLAPVPAPERYALMERCAQSETEYLYAQPCQVSYPMVKQTIEALSRKYRLFIVSNSQRGYPELCIEKLGMAPYIQGHLCYGDTGTSKGQTILRLMAEHKIESCVYIGDTQGDYEATLEAGIPFIWASYGFGSPEGYAEKIQTFADLLNL